MLFVDAVDEVFSAHVQPIIVDSKAFFLAKLFSRHKK